MPDVLETYLIPFNEQSSVSHIFQKTTNREETEENLGNAPQRNIPERVRGSKERQKSKATKVSKSSKKVPKGGRMGKALRKQAIGKALFTVEEWLRRG